MFDIWKRPNPSTSTVEEVQDEMQSGMVPTSLSTHHSAWEEETTYKETLVETKRTDFTYGDSLIPLSQLWRVTCCLI